MTTPRNCWLIPILKRWVVCLFTLIKWYARMELYKLWSSSLPIFWKVNKITSVTPCSWLYTDCKFAWTTHLHYSGVQMAVYLPPVTRMHETCFASGRWSLVHGNNVAFWMRSIFNHMNVWNQVASGEGNVLKQHRMIQSRSWAMVQMNLVGFSYPWMDPPS